MHVEDSNVEKRLDVHLQATMNVAQIRLNRRMVLSAYIVVPAVTRPYLNDGLANKGCSKERPKRDEEVAASQASQVEQLDEEEG
jgi:hypothetical protein